MTFGLFNLAIRNLKRKSFRTLVLVLSIGLLVATLVFGASFIFSVSTAIERASARFGADLLVVPSGARESAEVVLLENSAKSFYMDRSIIERVREVDGITAVTWHTYLETIFGVCCDIPPVKIVAINQDTDFIVKPWLTKTLKRKLQKGEAIIGYEANDNLGLLDVNSSVLFNKKFSFVGVLNKTGTGLDNAIFISDENIEDIIKGGKSALKPDQISLIFTRVKEGLDPHRIGGDVESAIVEVDVIPRSDIGKGIISTLKDINRIFLITMTLASVISIFLTWTIFSAIVNERAREIGILRAIGARGRDVVNAFLIEVLALGFMGSAVGIIIGTSMSVGLASMFTLIRDLNVTMTLTDRLGIASLGLAVGIGISVAGSISSVFHLKRMEPLDALKEQ